MRSKSSSPLFPKHTVTRKIPHSHRAQGISPTINITLGANREGKERVKGKASRIPSSRLGSALACVRQNAQHRKLKLPESTLFMLNTVLMVAVSTFGSTGVSPPSLSSQNIKSHETSPTSPRARGKAPTTSLALGTNPEGKERVKGNASRIQCSRVGSALVCVRRNVQHLELKRLVESARFVLNTVLIVAVSTCGPTGASPPPFSSQNIQSLEKPPISHMARGETQSISLALDVNPEGKERVKGKASRIQSSQIGSVLVCVRRNAQHIVLNTTIVCVCVVLSSHLFWTSGLWTYQSGSHRRKATQDFSSTFFLRCLLP